VIDYATQKIVHRIPVGRHPQRVRNGVVKVSIYPAGNHSERFRLGVFHERAPIGVVGGDEEIGCRAEAAELLRLRRCVVRLSAVTKRGAKAVVIGAGERFVEDRKSFKVDVDLNATGRALMRRRPRGFGVTLSARGVDSVGREQTVTKRIALRRGRS